MRRQSTFETRRAKRERWAKLTPRQRFLLLSDRLSDWEHEELFQHRTMTALENVYGPRVWDATVARIAEGEADGVDTAAAEENPDRPEMTLEEISDVLGISRWEVNRIIRSTLRKLREMPILQELVGYPMVRNSPEHKAWLIECALRSAKEATDRNR